MAITLAPERVFGPNADPARQVQAVRAFVALGNVLFVSLAALIPANGIHVILLVAILSGVQILREGVRLRKRRPELPVWTDFGFMALGIYTVEFVVALRLEQGSGMQDGVVYVMLILYAYSLGASWSLLGARD